MKQCYYCHKWTPDTRRYAVHTFAIEYDVYMQPYETDVFSCIPCAADALDMTTVGYHGMNLQSTRPIGGVPCEK